MVSEDEFVVESVSDVSEKYPRMEITKKGWNYAFLDFSTTEEKSLIVNFWQKDACVSMPVEYMKKLIKMAEEHSLSAIENGEFLKRSRSSNSTDED